MKNDGQTIEEKIEEIRSIATRNDFSVKYNTVVDILNEEREDIIEDVIQKLQQEYDIRVEQSEDEDYETDSSSGEFFIPADVNISQRPMNVYNLMERLENDEIDLSPAFQRRANLWPLEQQSRLIESLMLKIPIPTFYFNATDDDKWVIIDGLQRLSAFKNFLVGNKDESGRMVKEPLRGLQYLEEFDGITFDELPRQYMRRIKETSIVAYTVEKGTPDGVVYNIFQRINTGGLQLTPQEIRQALYGGQATELIKELAETREFLEATQDSISTKRMADREYVNRFIAFTELDYQADYKGNIDQFLIKGLKKVNSYKDKKQIKRIRDSFIQTMKYSQCIFGRYAFRKYNEEMRRGPINKALFESWSLVLSELDAEQLESLVKQKEKVISKFGKLLQKPSFSQDLKAGDSNSVARRIDAISKLVKDLL